MTEDKAPEHQVPLLEILYQDDFLVAINKPNGLLVHRSPIATNTNVFAVQVLRDQIGAKVSPVHRLDRKTSGILLFGLNPESTAQLQNQFKERKVNQDLPCHCTRIYRCRRHYRLCLDQRQGQNSRSCNALQNT